jgi:hypothetical protein
METITFKTHVGKDGILKLEMPKEVANRDVEITVTVTTLESQSTDANGWPIGYFDSTYGSLADNPIERGDQGQTELRDQLI